MKPIIDNFGSNQMLKDLVNQTHYIDIRIRLNGAYYWFEGNFLKNVLPYVEFEQVDNEGIKSKLENHKQIDALKPNDTLKHQEDSENCWCHPTVEMVDGNKIIIHNKPQ